MFKDYETDWCILILLDISVCPGVFAHIHCAPLHIMTQFNGGYVHPLKVELSVVKYDGLAYGGFPFCITSCHETHHLTTSNLDSCSYYLNFIRVILQ